MKDPGEQCDGTDFGGKTCASIGLESGNLICNSFCSIVASNCTPPENCNNGQDEDKDNLIDCSDSDCSSTETCLDSCFAPIPASVGQFLSGDTSGRPAILNGSCSNGLGPELVYQFTSPESATVTIQVWPWFDTDYTVSVRTACDESASEVACVNKWGQTFNSETLSFEAVSGQTYFVVVDGTSATDFGGFNIFLEIPPPESDFSCVDHFDNDGDGYLDCDDATNCQLSGFCFPGFNLVGAQCFDQSQCAATGNDPICLGFNEGFLDGYCSEFCDLLNPVCSGDGICVDEATVLGKPLSVNGLCLDTCLTETDCRPGYGCVDKGLAQKVCLVKPEDLCEDFSDNDLDELVDCADPDCQATATCSSMGDLATGQPCLTTTECFSNANDPVCLSALNVGWPDGYCSQFCDMALNDCGAGAICTSNFVSNFATPVCLDTCATTAGCRTNYTCQNIGLPMKVCVP